MRALILVALVLLAPVLADPKAEAKKAAVAFREAFARAQKPDELFPYMTRTAIASVESSRRKDPKEFAKVWELARLFSAMETMPKGARPIDELTVKGDRATYVTGYSVKDKDSSSTMKQTTELLLEDGVWKVDFRLDPPKSP